MAGAKQSIQAAEPKAGLRSVYVDASAWISLFTNEEAAPSLEDWLANEDGHLISTPWTLVEVASGFSIKVRRKELSADHAIVLFERFEQLIDDEVKVVAVAAGDYDHAMKLCQNAGSGLRAGDALHLASAARLGVSHLLTLDRVMAANAKALGIKLVNLGKKVGGKK